MFLNYELCTEILCRNQDDHLIFLRIKYFYSARMHSIDQKDINTVQINVFNFLFIKEF